MGQWFPKIGVYEPAGRRGRKEAGWNCHQYHAHSEFYADWGNYRPITLPEHFVVAASGKLISETRSGGKKTLTYTQSDIHDFAWTADPRYVVMEDFFDPEKDIPGRNSPMRHQLLGRSEDDLKRGMRPVKLLFYMQPDHAGQWQRYAGAQKWALAWLGLYAFAYPYQQVSCIDTPEDGPGAAGMEYQTLYTAGTARILETWPFNRIRIPETVVVHEFGHGYFYGLLASNEFEESWMDEGITSFAEYQMMEGKYRTMLEGPFGIGLRGSDISRGFVSASAGSRAVVALPGASRPMGLMPRTPMLVLPCSSNSSGGSWVRLPSGEASENTRSGGDSTTPPAAIFSMPWGFQRLRASSEFVKKTWYGTGWVDFAVSKARSEEIEPFTGIDDQTRCRATHEERSVQRRQENLEKLRTHHERRKPRDSRRDRSHFRQWSCFQGFLGWRETLASPDSHGITAPGQG